MEDTGEGLASDGERGVAELGLDAAERIGRQQRTGVVGIEAEMGMDHPGGLGMGNQAGVKEGFEGRRSGCLYLDERWEVQIDLPAAAAGIFAVRAHAAKGVGV